MRKNTSEFAEKMTGAAQEAGARVAYMLRAIYRDCPEKEVARSLDVDPRTVRDWLAGKTPNGTHLVALCQRYGRSFSDFVLSGPSWVDEARLEAEIAALRVRADLLEMQIQQESQEGRKQCASGPRGR